MTLHEMQEKKRHLECEKFRKWIRENYPIAYEDWLYFRKWKTETNRRVLAKVGTMSSEVVLVDRRPVVGKPIRYRHLRDSERWYEGVVDKVDLCLVLISKR